MMSRKRQRPQLPLSYKKKSTKEKNTSCQNLQTVTPLDTLETLDSSNKTLQKDRIILDYESKVRPSEYFAERCRASKNSSLETLLHDCHVSSHPLQDWQEYISYYTARYNNPQVEFQIRQRCVRSCIYMPQYKNDAEFVKVLIHYAKLCQDPLEEFAFAWKCRVGRDMAMFWMSWTWFAEKAKDYRLTLKLFEKSLECVKGEKMTVVKERFACFKLRMRDLGIDLRSLRDDDDDSNVDCEIIEKENIKEKLQTRTPHRRRRTGSTSMVHKIEEQEETPLQKRKPSRIAASSATVSALANISNATTAVTTSTKKQTSSNTNSKRRKRSSKGTEKKHCASIYLNNSDTTFEIERAKNHRFTQSQVSNFNHLHSRSPQENMQPVDYRSCHAQDVDHALQKYKSISKSLPKALVKSTKKNGVTFVHNNVQCQVLHTLGKGSYGTVLLCQDSNGQEFALKIQVPSGCLAWEYQVLTTLHKQKCFKNVIPTPISLDLYDNGGVMSMDAGSRTGCNLLDLVNLYEGNLPELLCIHYTYVMLSTIEKLHFQGKYLHCDVKPDNWIVVNEKNGTASTVKLIDFGRAIKINKQGFKGNVAAKDLDCIAMKKGRKFLYDTDAFGLCVCTSVLLWGSYMELETIGEEYQIKQTFRRYWKTDLWKLYFGKLLDVNEKTYKQDLRNLKKQFAEHLEEKKIELKQVFNVQNELLKRRQK